MKRRNGLRLWRELAQRHMRTNEGRWDAEAVAAWVRREPGKAQAQPHSGGTTAQAEARVWVGNSFIIVNAGGSRVNPLCLRSQLGEGLRHGFEEVHFCFILGMFALVRVVSRPPSGQSHLRAAFCDASLPQFPREPTCLSTAPGTKGM